MRRLALVTLAIVACSNPTMTLTSATPDLVSARGGEVLTLRGSGFASDSVVRLNGDVVPSKLVDGTTIDVTLPPLWAGKTSISIESSGLAATLADAIAVAPLDLRFVQAPPYSLAQASNAALRGAVASDFDGDGVVDLVFCHAGETCSVLRGDGQGNFLSAQSTESGMFRQGPKSGARALDSRAVVAADFDGDGDVDLFVADGTTGPGAIARNDGHGTFQSIPLAPSKTAKVDGVTAVAVADVDGDGTLDLILGSTIVGAPALRILFNRSTSAGIAFVEAPADALPPILFPPTAIAVGDLDGDHHEDLLLATPGAADGTSLRWLHGDGARFVTSPVALPAVVAVPTALALGDVDGDGALDIVAAGVGQDRLYLNDGKGHFFDSTTASFPVDAASATSIVLVDLDRDRDLDLVIGSSKAVTRVYINDGKAKFIDRTPLLPLASDETTWVAAADIDRDGDQDLLVLGAAKAAHLYLSVEPVTP